MFPTFVTFTEGECDTEDVSRRIDIDVCCTPKEMGN